jgi:uncharacterized protein (TIGR00369 family)
MGELLVSDSPQSSHGVPFHDHTHIEVLEVREGSARVRAPDLPELKNHLGTLHGGMLFTIGEIAAAMAITRLLGADLANLRAITRRGSVEYVKPARGGITAVSQLSMTRDEIFGALQREPSIDVPISVECKDDTGVTVARLTVSWFIGRPKT